MCCILLEENAGINIPDVGAADRSETVGIYYISILHSNVALHYRGHSQFSISTNRAGWPLAIFRDLVFQRIKYLVSLIFTKDRQT